MTDYQTVTVWIVIRRFLLGWLIGIGLLTVVSCVRYREFIAAAFAGSVWAWINAALPAGIMIFAIGYLVKSIFR